MACKPSRRIKDIPWKLSGLEEHHLDALASKSGCRIAARRPASNDEYFTVLLLDNFSGSGMKRWDMGARTVEGVGGTIFRLLEMLKLGELL